MSVTVETADSVITDSLTFERTVPRGLVHRWSLSEVFLTDYREVDARRFACAAQLPLSHGYFRDQPALPGFHDPLNVLEAARQAVTYAAHEHQGLAPATTFMVTAWSLVIADPDALACGVRPGRLLVDGAVTDRKARGGQVRGLVFAMDLTLDDRPLAHLTMDVKCTPTDQYHTLRQMQRGGAVPTAFTLPAEAAGQPVAPAAVGRIDPRNVVLDDLRRAPGVLSAQLSPRTFANRSMYDHPYDHVPAMVFSEAARQCALLLAEPGRVLRLDGTFSKFAELDSPVGLAARPDGDGCRMTAIQDDDTVAEIDITLG